MMVNDASFPDTTFSRFVAEHEIAHTWFPFYMGINETRYGFMDEGWATALEYLRNEATMGPAKATAFFKEFRVEDWINDPSPLQDLPIITPQDMLKGVAYGNNAYGKAGLGYLALKDLLGDAMFRQTLHAFIDRWNGKHPIPWDYFNTVNDVAKENLNWFWDAWFFRNAYIDVAISSARKTTTGYTVVLDNVGGMPSPVDLVITYADGSTETRHQTPRIWAANTSRATVALAARKPVTRISLGGGIFMDAQATNDTWDAR
jgi:aminopeptidase N